MSYFSGSVGLGSWEVGVSDVVGVIEFGGMVADVI